MRSLRRHVLAPVAVLGAVVVVGLAYLAWEGVHQSRALERNAAQVRTATSLAFAVGEAVADEARWVLLLASAPDAAAQAPDPEARIDAIAGEVEALDLSPRGRRIWRRFQEARATSRTLAGGVLAAAQARDEAALRRAIGRWRLASERVAAVLEDFTAHKLNQLDRTVAELQERRARSFGTAAAAVVAGFLLAGAFALWLARSVVAPIVAMARAAQRIDATGPLQAVPGAERADELGVLSRALNAMAERLVGANERLAEAVRARDDFISIASHELKTPITSMLLRVQGMSRAAERDGAPEGATRAARVLEKQIARLSKLVESLLDVSRITSGRLALRLEEVVVAGAARDAVDRMSDELAAAGCPVAIDEGPEPGLRVRADRSRVEQVIVNLLGNAAKYAPGAAVTVRIRRDGAAARIEVEDAGRGIAPEDRERVFQRFERAADEREVTGLGLGLFIAREIARAHGGDLHADGAPGRGAIFVLRLPGALASVDRSPAA